METKAKSSTKKWYDKVNPLRYGDADTGVMMYTRVSCFFFLAISALYDWWFTNLG